VSRAGAPRRLVVVRHGRTAWNDQDRVQGQQDVELDDAGHAQAAAVAPALAALGPGLLWSSDLARARQTAAYVAKETGLEPAYDARLREFDLGEREGLTHAEYAATAPEEFAEFRLGRYDVAPGAEPTAAVRRRMTAALRDLLAVAAPGEPAIAVSHGAAIKVAVPALLGWPDEAAEGLRGLDNCSWVELEQSADGRLRLAAYGRTA
jgi:glucosyl-3-phosphoglycerate phosphatase